MQDQIFISYRRDGGETMAQILHDKLKERGYRVFYDIESLKSGQFDEKLLDKIEECQDVIVILSAHALDRCVNDGDWVRREIGHALQLGKNTVPVIMRGFSFPNELPEDIAPVVKMNGVPFEDMYFLEARLDKLAAMLISKPAEKADGPAKLTPLVKRAFLCLEDGEFAKADELCEQALNQDPEYAEAYLGKLLAATKCRYKEALCELEEPLDGQPLYKKAVRFASPALASELQEYNRYIREHMVDRIYTAAVLLLNHAATFEECNRAAAEFKKILSHPLAESKIRECNEKAAYLIKKARYENACKAQTDRQWERAIQLFSGLSGFMDADRRLRDCQNKTQTPTALTPDTPQPRSYKKPLLIATVSVLIILLITAIVLAATLIPQYHYDSAFDLMNEKNYQEAIEVFESLNGYKESEKQILRCRYYMALELKQSGAYMDAAPIFEGLGDYENSPTEYKDCRYHIALDYMNEAAWQEAAVIFESLSTYKDSQTLLAECQIHIDDGNKTEYELIYEQALSYMDSGNYEAALSLFVALDGYRDSETLFIECRYRIAQNDLTNEEWQKALSIFESLGPYKDSEALVTECRYQIACDYMANEAWQDALSIFESLEGYRDSESLAAECQSYLGGTDDFETELAYQEALTHMENGNYLAALSSFEPLGSYKDSESLATECRYQIACNYIANQQWNAALSLLKDLVYAGADGDAYKDSADLLAECQIQLDKGPETPATSSIDGTIETPSSSTEGGFVVETPDFHTHSYDQTIISEETFLKAATTRSGALYAFSCTCGQIGTTAFEYGDPDPYAGFVIELPEGEDGAVISRYEGDEADPLLPTVYEGIPIARIGQNAFCNLATLQTLTIPEGIVTIDGGAIGNLPNLHSISIPSSTVYMSEPFLNCQMLNTITVAEGNPVYHAANNCLIETATGVLFAGCNTSVIPDDGSVTEISSLAFGYCINLTEIRIPSSVTYISPTAFLACSALTSVIVDPYNPVYRSVNNCIIHIAEKELVLGCETSTIPDDGSVERIGSYAFSDRTMPTKITVPSSVTLIGIYAFSDCTNLSEIVFEDSNAVWYGTTSYSDWLNRTNGTEKIEVSNPRANITSLVENDGFYWYKG